MAYLLRAAQDMASLTASGQSGDNADDIDLIEFSQTEQEALEAAKGEKCGSCNESFKDKTRYVQCEVCLLWFHLKCIGVSTKLYNCLLESPNNLHLYCYLAQLW